MRYMGMRIHAAYRENGVLFIQHVLYINIFLWAGSDLGTYTAISVHLDIDVFLEIDDKWLYSQYNL